VRVSWALTLAVVMLALSQTSHACMCNPRPDIEDQYRNYSEIFLGAITDVHPIAADSEEKETARFRVMTKVIEVYKGDPPETVSGFTSRDPADTSTYSCGPDYELGHFYIVFRGLTSVTVNSDPKMPPKSKRRYSRPLFSVCSHTVWPVSDEVLEYLRTRKDFKDDA